MTTVGKYHHNPTVFADVVCGQIPLDVWVDSVLNEARAALSRWMRRQPESVLFAQGRLHVARVRVESENGSPVVEFEVRRATRLRVYRRTLSATSEELEGGHSEWVLMTAEEIHFHKAVASPVGKFLDACGVSAPWADSDLQRIIGRPSSSAWREENAAF